MEKNRTVQHRQGKRKGKPKVRFNFWVMFIIFVLSFAACFVLYMLAANFNGDFFKDEFDSNVIEEQNPLPDAQQTTDASNKDNSSENSNSVSITNPVPQSPAVDASYFDSACLITDSTLIQMADYGKFNSANIFSSTELNAIDCNTTKVSSNFGTVSVYDIVKNKKPDVLYIMLGSDLGTSDSDEMIASYTTLVNNLHSALNDMKIYVMQIPPVIYDTETITNEMINNYNNKLLAMANAIGVYCIDTNTALKSESGVLAEKFYSYETLDLSAEGYSEICGYILTHTS